ncbi:MAG: tyrosine--tRNA ligase [archaeon]
MTLSVDEKLDLIKQVGEEIVEEEELINLLKSKKNIVAYDGFEPSGKIHIAQGLLKAININKMTSAGIKFKMLVADWHAWANNKMGGDLEKIQVVGEYFIEVWKASGLDLKNVEFVWASELLNNREYWKTVLQIARNTTVKRILRCGQIMGRKEGEVQQASQIIYPCMQAADIFHLKADICQLAMHQRKVNVLAREIGEKIGFYKPVIVSHHMLMGLLPPKSNFSGAEKTIEQKMSKSNPASSIFMTDSSEEIESKFRKAYCPEGEIKDNPVLEYFKYIIFEKISEVVIERSSKFGGDVIFKKYSDMEKSFKKKEVHPLDLKKSAAKYINNLLEPVRKHFKENKRANDLLKKVESFEITR